MRRLAEEAAARFADAPAEEVLRWAGETFGSGFCVTSSFEDAVTAHLAARAVPGVDVVFLDTGYHFEETIGTRDAVAELYDVNVVNVLPRLTVAEQDAEHGPKLHDRAPDRCCALRKVEPLEGTLAGYEAWATGLHRYDSPLRADTPVVEWDAKRDMVKVNPVVAWTPEQVHAYIEEHGVLVNPLLDDGYPSIGCAPCTRRVAPGEDIRAGRWSGTGKTECGLHV
ncbi:phosphoadenosine phosphosulfate reductase [Mangrovactinospora gilvigrisea]|uniref:Adenosine 5'-phosphosulfate reductase n=1 Tax=Mangrovactinospora gilvigrisea TaxID=1428644 RepID=A0A1J7C1M8_9ACTN|nr:phosphoadenosine phosphosulfate reductase [Mangrovactinospora gilvigrisea]